MKKIENRYLNLMGAPWSPTQPDARLTLSNCFAAAASAAIICSASFVNPSVKDNALLYLLEGAAGSATAVYLRGKLRTIEAEQLSSANQQLVIDTQPDKNTPPTSPDILGRIHALKHQYMYGLPPFGVAGAGLGFSLAATHTWTLFTDSKAAMIVFVAYFMPVMFIHSSDVLSRYRQFNKIANLEWAISDRGDAVHKFQQEEIKNLNVAHGAALVPIRLN